ncbi:NAC domain-containing protein 78-like [Solanum stenotomum]|uniref:NAC domain-containing protein 78-like n=1 Tax=Solanum stenotomum TaxID=172797 RepID=UPI0020D073A4|nr:NAC domain-containing protein 78-like [Solanum stenotomum]
MARGKGSRLGYSFSPKNIEVMKYLVGFTRDEPLPNQNQYMEVVNLYAENEPWQIFEGTNSYTCYFITPQKKQNLKWKKVSRTVGKGTWKPQGKGKEVFDNKGRLMGYVKSLKYTYGKSDNKNVNGEWLMTKYDLNDGYLEAREIKNKGYVICKIKKKRKPNDDNENGVSDENMNGIEKLIDSSLQLDDDINVEEDDVGNEVLATLDKEDDGDPNVECLEGHP